MNIYLFAFTHSQKGAILYEIQLGREEIVELLLRNGVDINSINKNGSTALDIAVEKGFGKIVEILMQGGANPKLENKNGKTAIDIANEKGKTIFIYKIMSTDLILIFKFCRND